MYGFERRVGKQLFKVYTLKRMSHILIHMVVDSHFIEEQIAPRRSGFVK